MSGKIQRVLFVNSEMSPYLESSPISSTTRALAQGIQEQMIEIRAFMPRYGLINERKNQLHEVIRLSGMNIVIGDVDRPLVIKVASLPSSRMQVYFIDNEDYFRRKALFGDSHEAFFKDNGERAIFFARGVLETVKKLRWSPDIIHCSGWMSQVLPIYLKKSYKDDPIFSDSKVVLSLYGDTPQASFSPAFARDICYQGISDDNLSVLDDPSGINLAKLAIGYSDGVVFGCPEVDAELKQFVKESNVPFLEFDEKRVQDSSHIRTCKEFYESLR